MGRGSQRHRKRHTKRTPSGIPSRAKNNVHEFAVRAEAEKPEKKKFAKPDPDCFGLQRQALYCLFLGQQALGYEMTCAGRLRIVGALDGLDVDPSAILAALQRYTLLYWGEYRETAVRMGELGSVGGGSRYHGRGGAIPDDPTGERFAEMDRLLIDAGREARLAVHSVTVDRHWFPDENAPWADAIINQRILEKRELMLRGNLKPPAILKPYGDLPKPSDWQKLEHFRRGAVALAA